MEAVTMKPGVLFYLLLVTSLSAMVGCNPYEFNLGDRHHVNCKVTTALGSVEDGNNTAALHPGGAFNMSYFGATEYYFRAGLQVKSGDGVRVLIRPVVQENSVIDSGLSLSIARSGVQLSDHGTLLASDQGVVTDANTIVPFSILSDNQFLQIVVGCDTIYKKFSKIQESDDLYFESIKTGDSPSGSEVEIIAPDWSGVPTTLEAPRDQ